MMDKMQNKMTKTRHTAFSQAGFTITELMITIALSLSVISSVLVGYMATYTSSMDTLAASKINQDLNAVMNLMVTELRRAGFSAGAVTASDPTTNVYNQVDNTALEVFDSMTSNTQLVPAGDGTWINTGGSPAATVGTCIVYGYDLDEDSTVEATELGGFRLNNGVVEMRTSGNVADPDTCATANNTWSVLTDSDFITVTALTFNLNASECLNTREPDGVDNDADSTTDEADEADCYDAPMPAAASGDITVETRQIAITLTGNLTEDSFVQISLTQNIRVRNDLVRVR